MFKLSSILNSNSKLDTNLAGCRVAAKWCVIKKQQINVANRTIVELLGYLKVPEKFHCKSFPTDVFPSSFAFFPATLVLSFSCFYLLSKQ